MFSIVFQKNESHPKERVPRRDVVVVVLLVGFWPFLEMFVLALVWSLYLVLC
jgi:uncharacterized paraquat-inducible protein A